MDARFLIDGLGGYRSVAAELAQKIQTVHNWMRRGSIPAEFWPWFLEHAPSASDETIRSLTLADLAGMRERASLRQSSTTESAEAA